MDSRVIDITSAVVSGAVLLVFLITLPGIMDPGLGYLLAMVIFILTMSGAGFYLNKTIS
jgi:hypothetical protein